MSKHTVQLAIENGRMLSVASFYLRMQMFHFIVCDVDAINEFFDQALLSKEIYVDMYSNITPHKSDIKSAT